MKLTWYKFNFFGQRKSWSTIFQRVQNDVQIFIFTCLLLFGFSGGKEFKKIKTSKKMNFDN